MGQTIKNLAKVESLSQAIFNNRFVVEACEDFHFHYRNLRIRISYADWGQFAKGFSDAYLRWEKQGRPFGKHTELCRKIIAMNAHDDGIQVNLNKNLYKLNKDKIFSEGEGTLQDDEYVHLKFRDLRLEMTKEEFKTFAQCVAEAVVNL
jgi:hypothetical protein